MPLEIQDLNLTNGNVKLNPSYELSITNVFHSNCHISNINRSNKTPNPLLQTLIQHTQEMFTRRQDENYSISHHRHDCIILSFAHQNEKNTKKR